MKELISDINYIQKDDPSGIQISKNETGKGRKFYIESYGCAMNFADSEVVTSILHQEGMLSTSDYRTADLILLNTCSIREKAELTVRKRLTEFNQIKKKNKSLTIGVLGCMAERLKSKFLEEEKIVDLVAGPDSYRDLPNLIKQSDQGQEAVNTFLSREETYADIAPVRLNSNGVSAFVSIMRGCDNMCTFCVVPFTRGRERSRDPLSILKECQEAFNAGYREVSLLGQNVDSYKWESTDNPSVNFAELLEKVALVHPDLRVRFSTSHPKDITDQVLYTIAKYENICNNIHLPVQSGNSQVLERMNRTYTREWYLERVEAIRRIIGPNTGISSDMIAGFCGETEAQHKDTLTLMEKVNFHYSYMYYYSERPGTLAAKKFEDDVSLKDKKRRLQEIIDLQRLSSLAWNQKCVGQTFKVLIEGVSKKSDAQVKGRASENYVIVFDGKGHTKGEYVEVKVTSCTGATLLGEIVKGI